MRTRTNSTSSHQDTRYRKASNELAAISFSKTVLLTLSIIRKEIIRFSRNKLNRNNGITTETLTKIKNNRANRLFKKTAENGTAIHFDNILLHNYFLILN